MQKKVNFLDVIALLILIIGGINWLLVGLFNYNLVARLAGNTYSTIVYAVVGIAAIYMLYFLIKRKK